MTLLWAALALVLEEETRVLLRASALGSTLSGDILQAESTDDARERLASRPSGRSQPRRWSHLATQPARDAVQMHGMSTVT